MLFATGEVSPVPLQGEQRIPYKRPEPWQVGHSRVGAFVEVVIEPDHTLYLLQSCEYSEIASKTRALGIFTAEGAEGEKLPQICGDGC